MEAHGVIPAKAGIQFFQAFLDPGFRRGDDIDNLIFLKLMTLGCTSLIVHGFPHKIVKRFYHARVAELADALDLGSSGATCGGSNPPSRTI